MHLNILAFLLRLDIIIIFFIFRNVWLKYRLARDYPEKLLYHKSVHSNISELVTCADVTIDEVMNAISITKVTPPSCDCD